MKITIVNGINENTFRVQCKSLNDAFTELKVNNQITLFDANKLNIHHCTGCWSCWLKDPGKCVFDDDMAKVYTSIIKSDLLIFVSSIKAGFIQSEIKKVIDRMFAVLLPHMTILKGELHHIPRYDNQPRLGLLIVGEDNPTAEQEEILKEYLYRLSLNFNKAKGTFLHYYNCDMQKEFINEVNNI